MDIEEDEDTGRVDAKPKGGIITQARTPDTDDYPLSLDYVQIIFISGDNVEILIPLPANDEISLNGLDDRNELIALRTWLEDNRTSGSAVGTDVSTVTSFNSRNYTVTFGDNTQSTVFTVGSIVTEGTADAHITLYKIGFDQSSGASFTYDDLRATFDEATADIPVTEGIEKPALGSEDSRVAGLHYGFPEGQRLYTSNGRLIWRLKDPDGSKIDIPLDSERSIRYTDLPSNSNNQKIMKKAFLLDTVHFGHTETADGVFRFETPPTMIEFGGTHKVYAIHNISTTYNIEIRDWDNDVVITLTPGQYTRIQITLELRWQRRIDCTPSR